ncbi:MAG TPA: response regulator [Gammaproteobacteria bacterium]|nr:response regulator [Gammaproteobacteria bacterium]
MVYKLLIVDDSKLARMAVVKALQSCHPDWQRVEAGNADDALRTAQRDPPDIALIDFNMPNKNGLDLAADLRALSPDMPIGIISANHQQQVIDRARSLGAVFLPKPLTEKALREFLATASQQLQGVPS